MLTQPSQVSLDFQDTPLAEAVHSRFSEQTGIKLVLRNEEAPNWQNRTVTVHEAAPLPFWKAIDRFCDAAHLQYNFGMSHRSRAAAEPTSRCSKAASAIASSPVDPRSLTAGRSG